MQRVGNEAKKETRVATLKVGKWHKRHQKEQSLQQKI